MWEELITSLPTVTNHLIITRVYKSDQRLIDNGHIVQCTTCHTVLFKDSETFWITISAICISYIYSTHISF